LILEKKAVIKSNQLAALHVIRFQFRQLMHNLINNALKFSASGKPPKITINSKIVKGSKLDPEIKSISAIAFSPNKKYCHLSFKDNGIGFEPQYKERIFNVFQKLHGKEEYAGTGIGLSIVKKIVENHNGIIRASSELNDGATFDIYIPME
jgi:two-component system, chemotaxis family, CheB/CheR fusion protein